MKKKFNLSTLVISLGLLVGSSTLPIQMAHAQDIARLIKKPSVVLSTYVVIFGRSGCPYCIKAKEIAEQLSHDRKDFSYRYIDMPAEKITKEDLSKSIGVPVNTVPQIFVDGKLIGGSSDFEVYATKYLGYSVNK